MVSFFRKTIIFFGLIPLLNGSVYGEQPNNLFPKVHAPSLSYEFSPLLEGKKVNHDFILQNQGDGVLNIIQVKTG